MADDPLFNDVAGKPAPDQPGLADRAKAGARGFGARLGDAWRGFWSRIRLGLRKLRGSRTNVSPMPPATRWRWIKRVGLTVLIFPLIYYPVGMIIMHRIGDNTSFTVTPPAGHARSVAIAAALLEREVDTYRWTPNDPFFVPSWALDNLPNFQRGIHAALLRFSIEMVDEVGRTRGSSRIDADLEQARNHLSRSPDTWVFNFPDQWYPTATADAEYRKAKQRFQAYNTRLAQGQAVFERRADNLLATIDRINSDLGSQSAILEQRMREHGGEFFDTRSDDVYYQTKGRLYTYYLLLREFAVDFKPVLDEKQLGPAWNNMLESMRQAAILQPLIVRNGKPDSMLMPSHLAAQGFYVLRARLQLQEISNILLK